jgi:hypothetical protein
MFRFVLLALGAVTLLLVDGFVYGRWTGRWHDTQELRSASARLERLPMEVGDWKGEKLDLDPKAVELASFSGYVLRRYENQRTHAMVNLLVACGRRGPLTVHTPEVCYAGAGFRLVAGAGAKRERVEGTNHRAAEFYTGTFGQEDPNKTERLRVIWCWWADGAFQAPENPRWTFRGQPVLHKLYLTQVLPRDNAKDGEACLDFFREILPDLEKAIAAD